MLKPDDRVLPPSVEAAYRRASGLVMEMNLKEAAAEAATAPVRALSLLPDERTLAGELGPEAYARFEAAAPRLGIDPAAVAHYRPWFVALLVTQAAYASEGYAFSDGVESQLSARAEADGKPVIGLETMTEQLGLFAALTADDQRRLLLYSLDDSEESPALLEEVVAAWRRGDARALETLLSQGFDAFPELYAPLTSDRNRRWIPTFERLLGERRDYLVIVGALHLVGPQGVLEQLRARGYRVTQR